MLLLFVRDQRVLHLFACGTTSAFRSIIGILFVHPSSTNRPPIVHTRNEQGKTLRSQEVTERAAERGGPINHTFYFSLADGNVIDGGRRGNDARWINHACEPNCEAYEEDGRVYIHALRDIDQGEELNYNYALIYDERHTPALKRLFACRCGTPACSGTMLAPKRRAKKQASASA
jgi:hypothetical protein